MSDRLEFFRFYAEAFFASARVMELTAAGVGTYLELLWQQWRAAGRGLPRRPEALERLVRATPEEWREAWADLEAAFPISADGRRRNRLLWIEWVLASEAVEAASERARRAGLASGRVRQELAAERSRRRQRERRVQRRVQPDVQPGVQPDVEPYSSTPREHPRTLEEHPHTVPTSMVEPGVQPGVEHDVPPAPAGREFPDSGPSPEFAGRGGEEAEASEGLPPAGRLDPWDWLEVLVREARPDVHNVGGYVNSLRAKGISHPRLLGLPFWREPGASSPAPSPPADEDAIELENARRRAAEAEARRNAASEAEIKPLLRDYLKRNRLEVEDAKQC